ncbi:hypothetical protein M5K25_019901 [Dendrobium thyrsiflorum]|uniref:Uncharacterized protein n=1 Tax=Dendrobium thyrsiflorum TaxID=117978 RepID=A0ABD0UN28_DENTH
MLAISATNSFIPCLESWEILFTAISSLDFGDIEHHALAIIICPNTHRFAANQAQIFVLETGGVEKEGCRGGGDRCQSIDIDADVIVVDVIKLPVLYGIELDGDDVVAGIAVIGEVEEAKVLAWEDGGEVGGRGYGKGDAMGADVLVLGKNGEDEGGGEGEGRPLDSTVPPPLRRRSAPSKPLKTKLGSEEETEETAAEAIRVVMIRNEARSLKKTGSSLRLPLPPFTQSISVYTERRER